MFLEMVCLLMWVMFGLSSFTPSCISFSSLELGSWDHCLSLEGVSTINEALHKGC